MAILTVLTTPDPRLKIKAKPIKRVDATTRQLMDDMLETMYHYDGVGLAATQVGVDKRVIVIDIANRAEGEAPTPYLLANPEIIETSAGLTLHAEGCLSVPGYYSDVERPTTCTVTALNREGEAITIHAEGLLALCLQHEIDHLNGVLFIDHLSRLKRTTILQRLEKDKKFGRVNQYRKTI